MTDVQPKDLEEPLDPSGPEPEPLDEFEPLPFEDSEVHDVEDADA